MKEIYKTFTSVAGTEHRKKNAEKVYDLVSSNTTDMHTDKVRFELEPENKYDKYAIKIYIYDIFVGYVPRRGLRKLRSMLHSEKYICKLTADIDFFEDEPNFIVHFTFYKKQ